MVQGNYVTDTELTNGRRGFKYPRVYLDYYSTQVKYILPQPKQTSILPSQTSSFYTR